MGTKLETPECAERRILKIGARGYTGIWIPSVEMNRLCERAVPG